MCNKVNGLISFYILISLNSSTHSTVSHIQQCHKFNCLISFYILISFNSLTYSIVSQIELYYLISHSCLIQYSHIFNHVTNSTVLSRFTFSSITKVYKFTSFIWFHSLISFKVPHIQNCNKVNGLISFYILISFNSPTYSTVSQIQLYYNFHVHISFNSPNIFNNVTNSTVLSDSTV